MEPTKRTRLAPCQLLMLSVALPFLAAAGRAQTNPVPVVNQPVLPDAVAPGTPGFTLTVNGTGFVQGSVVDWAIGGVTTPLSTTFVSGSQLTATVPASSVAAGGTPSVTITSPPPGGGVSNPALLQITIPTSAVSLARTDSQGLNDSSWATTGDFNNDGKPDLAATSFEGGVSVLLGNGDGTFQPTANYGTGESPQFVVTGDFNSDGITDLITANQLGTVSVLLGNGDGTFQPQKETTVGGGAQWVAVGDFNQDGNEDIVVTDLIDDAVWVLLGNGDGTFRSPAAASAIEFPDAVAVGDFNGDGKLDIAVDGFTGTAFAVAIALGNGDGTFQPPLDYPTPGGQFPVTAVDLNGDGILDLAVGAGPIMQEGVISILLGNGDGTFKPYVDYPVSGPPRQIVTGDFNGDGKVDLAEATSEFPNEMSILLGNGDGTFRAQTDYGTSGDTSSLAAADFNRDGALDLAVVNGSFADSFSIFLQQFVPVVTLLPSSLTFSGENLGVTSPAQTVTLANTGNFALTISSVAITGMNPGDFAQTSTCPISPFALAIGASCAIGVTFTPAVEGARTASVSITDNASGSPQTLALTGTGDAPVLSLSTNSINFGDVFVDTTSSTLPVTLTNVGNEPLSITKIAASGGFGLSLSGCTRTLAAGASCTLKLDFAPTKPGQATGTISITDNAAGSPQTVALAGTGIAFALSTTSLNFGRVPVGQTSSPQSVTVRNVSKNPQSISVRVTGTSAGEFPQSNNCGATLAAKSSCGITVNFAPKNGGAASATLNVNGGGADQTVSLSGTGTSSFGKNK